MQAIQKKPAKKFLTYIHYFRGLAISFIIAIHVFASLEWENELTTGELFFKVLFDDATLIFVFISGFLFQHLSKKFTFKKYLNKKFRYVLKPYLLISIPVIIIRIYFEKPPTFIVEQIPSFENWSVFAQIPYYIATGSHLRPFWFIPMLVLFYAIAPLLVALDRNKKIYYILPFLVINSFIFTRGNLNEIVTNFIHFLPIYLLGMFCSRYKEEVFYYLKKYIWLLLTVGIISFIVTLIEDNSRTLFIQKLSLTFIVLFFLKEYSEKFHPFIIKILDTLALYSFGLYFVHDYFDLAYKFILEHFTGDYSIDGSIIIFLGMFTAIIILSLSTLSIFKNILGEKSREYIGC
ncbi:acyltransferase family protein [Chondrinema litorale]|uniref:acyltransferase family protein n=1 Tax=Chondrinema litorale TaxID=2994555 RepID=UPI002542FFDD|nr:acyltransferase [Chondrinema litorale]UZR94774.1 acyltransferase [Chondrinema litorale]